MMYFPMLVFLVGVAGLLLLYCQLYSDDNLSTAEEWAKLVSEASEETVDMASTRARERRAGCHFYNSDCFDVYRCGRMNGRLKGGFFFLANCITYRI
jgi:hypothetical protein